MTTRKGLGRLGLRSDLESLDPYEPPARAEGLRLDSNESPYPPPPELIDDLTAALSRQSLNRYPDHGAGELLDALADASSWQRDGVWVGNGSNEILFHLFLAFGGPGRTSVTFEPTYSLHTLIGRMTGTDVTSLPRDRDFRVAGIERVEADIVMLCSPNNPTGGLERAETLKGLLAEPNRLVVIDEAYIDFSPAGATFLPLLEEHENLVIVRTFSKAWRLAGVRLGYLLAAPALVADLARVRLPYGLSSLSQQAGLTALKHAAGTRETIEKIIGERNRIISGLDDLGLKTHPTDANFVLFEVPRAESVWEALAARSVYVRGFGHVPSLQGCLRVTAGLPEETDEFLRALEEVLKDVLS